MLSTAWLKNCVPAPPNPYLAQNGAGHIEVRRTNQRNRGTKRTAKVVLPSIPRFDPTLQLPPIVSTSPSTRVTRHAPLYPPKTAVNSLRSRRPGSARSRTPCCKQSDSCTASTAACAAAGAGPGSKNRGETRRRRRR